MLVIIYTHSQYIERMDAHTGLHIDTVVRSFGPPDRVYDFENGQSVYQWYEAISGSTSFPIQFYPNQAPMYMNVPYTHYCSTIFYTNELGYTTNYVWNGNNCKWYEPGPIEFTEEELEGYSQ